MGKVEKAKCSTSANDLHYEKTSIEENARELITDLTLTQGHQTRGTAFAEEGREI